MSPQPVIIRLSCGLRIVALRRPSEVEICGVAVRAGSRDEAPGEEGLAHFVEHTIFKGTSRRKSSSIINRMEAVGGELNAYTTKEETYVYSIFPRGNLSRAVDLIADLVTGSQFPQDELDREREVVAEEIDSYLDTPSEAVFDDFDDLMFVGSSLGHNILGSRDTLRQFDSHSCRRFLERYYRATNMVMFYSGPMEPERVARVAERYLSGLPGGNVDRNPYGSVNQQHFHIRRNDGDNHQAHTVMGCLLPDMYSLERFPLLLINNVLGGPGMNSRLNIALRERRGLVYSVESSTSFYTDTGLLTIYFGCNPEDQPRCQRLVERELERISTDGLTDRRFEAARRQFLGQQIVASASAEQGILSAARQLLFRNTIVTRDEVTAIYQSLTPADLLTAASLLAPSRFSSLTLG